MPPRERLTDKRFWDRIATAERQAEIKGARFDDDTPTRQLERKARAVVHPEYFNSVYLPHYFRSAAAAFHVELYQVLEWSSFTAVRAPRGHAKSTVVTFAYSLHQVVCGDVLKAWELGTLEESNPELFAAIVDVIAEEDTRREAAWNERAAAFVPTEDEPELAPWRPVQLHWDPYIQIVAVTLATAKEFTEAIKVECEGNELIRSDWGVLVSDEGVNYADWVSTTDVRVRAFGMDVALRGGKHGPWRPTLAIGDDLDSLRTVSSESVRRKQLRKITASLSFGLEPKKKRLFVVGTPVHGECIVCELTAPDKFDRWTKLRYKAIQDDGTPLWPEVWTIEDLRAEERDDPDAFAMEMLDTPPTDGERPFPRLHYYARVDYEATLPKVLVFDPSMGQSKKSDWQALASLRGPTEKGKILLNRVERFRIPDPFLLVEHVNGIYADEDPDAAAIESIGFQLILQMMLMHHGQATQLFPGWLRIDRQVDAKDLRIRSMAPLVRTAVMLFPDDESCLEAERDFKSYPLGKVDVPDVVEMGLRLIRQFTRVRGRGQVRHEHRRSHAAFGGARAW